MMRICSILFLMLITTSNFASSNDEHNPNDILSFFATYDESLQNGDRVTVKGDVGSSIADYTIIKNGNTITVKGDIGSSIADYTILKE